MRIGEFCRIHGKNVRPAEEVLRSWRVREIDRLLEDAVAGGVILGDFAIGEGTRDAISPELLRGFSELMGGKADSYREVRTLIVDKLEAGDAAVAGLVNKIKGQVAENAFIREVGSAARLAASGSQEAWDVASDGAAGTQYVQVKLHGQAPGVVRKMREVQEKVEQGSLMDGDRVVEHVDFAVPSDIADSARDGAANYPELEGMRIEEIGRTHTELTAVVEDGVARIGPEALEHLFGQLLGGAVIAGSLHAAANAFMVYKGAKLVDEALADTAVATGVSAAGIGVVRMTESMLDFTVLGGPAALVLGMASRVYLSRLARSRWDFADFLEDSRSRVEGNLLLFESGNSSLWAGGDSGAPP